MQRTIFDTPVVNSSMHWLSRLLLWLTGWHVEGVAPTAPKYVWQVGRRSCTPGLSQNGA
jgi:hypothetical protein